MVEHLNIYLAAQDYEETALMLNRWVFLQMLYSLFVGMVFYESVWKNSFKNGEYWPWISKQPTFLPLMYHVILAAGNDVPTVHVALRLSIAESTFFSTCIRGSSFGNSITCIPAARISVWNSGASSDTSHWNC